MRVLFRQSAGARCLGRAAIGRRSLGTMAVLILVAGWPLASSAEMPKAGIRLRFREHLDVSRIHWDQVGVVQSYFGATNTVNLWWEKPGDYAIGLAFQPVLTSGYSQITSSRSSLVDDNVKLYQFGLEGRWMFWKDSQETLSGPFARAGVYAARLDVDPQFGGNRWGGSYYFSLGWEIPLFNNAIGLKPDVGFRHTILEQDTQILTFSPSIAASLYFVTDWLAGL